MEAAWRLRMALDHHFQRGGARKSFRPARRRFSSMRDLNRGSARNSAKIRAILSTHADLLVSLKNTQTDRLMIGWFQSQGVSISLSRGAIRAGFHRWQSFIPSGLETLTDGEGPGTQARLRFFGFAFGWENLQPCPVRPCAECRPAIRPDFAPAARQEKQISLLLISSHGSIDRRLD